jgi:signal transduction histidine kinase
MFGTLGVFSKKPRTFTEDEKVYIQACANVLGLAVQRQSASNALIALNKTLESRIEERTALARFLQQVASVASESESGSDALRGILGTVCGYMGWAAGHAYSITPGGNYVDTGIWSPDPPEGFAKLVEASARLTYTPGDGFVGRAAQSGRIEKILDVGNKALFRRARVARQAGMKSVVALPVRTWKRVTMVIEFFSAHALVGDDVLQAALDPVGGLLGRVFERNEMEKQVATIADHERRTMGRDLHDSVGQQLTGLGLLARSLQKKLDTGAPVEKGSVAHLVEQIDRAKMQIRALANGLLPVGLSTHAFVDAVRDFLETCRKTYEIDITLYCPRAIVIEDNFMANHLYRIVEEAVHNSVRHGKAGYIRVSLEADGNALRMTVQDDGTGFQSAKAREEGGNGLRIMRYRASLFGASIQIQSAKGKGTTVQCTVRTHGLRPSPGGEFGRGKQKSRRAASRAHS